MTLKKLNKYQTAHLAHFSKEDTEDARQYLLEGVDVFIVNQNECGDDVPPYAIAVAKRQEFWMDCCIDIDSAKQQAKNLGLQVVDLD